MICALIMAGGKGTRFWPKSTEEKPKQFLSLIDNKTMIQLTYERILPIIDKDKIFVITNDQYKGLVEEQLKDLPEKNIILEPVGRNTAPSILLASLYIKQKYADTNIVVLPSDHMINNTKNFCDTIVNANDYIDCEQKDAIVTVGITPNRAETEYGYIKIKKGEETKQIKKVEKFVEKPSKDKARRYLKSGKYLWNAGMFIFNVNSMICEFKSKFRQTYEILEKIPNISTKEYAEFVSKNYEKCDNLSIDYAIMEKSKKIYLISSNFEWDDIGTWNALQRYIKEDNSHNFVQGNVHSYNSKNNLVCAENGKKIVLIDVENIFCIESEDSIVIGKKDNISELYKYREKECNK